MVVKMLLHSYSLVTKNWVFEHCRIFKSDSCGLNTWVEIFCIVISCRGDGVITNNSVSNISYSKESHVPFLKWSMEVK